MSLKIARGLELPLDIVTRKTAILAKSGAGKSNTAKVIVEGVLDAAAQVVIFDPVGHWWGLRSLFPIPVLGGMNGDIPLDPLAGKLIADVAAESGQSLILDVSLMDSDGEMQRFAYEFAERFYKQKQLHPTAVLIVLEEADEFAPQDTRGANVPRMVGAWARIAKRGRGRGIGLLSVTLRSAALSKNVLNQSDGIVAMRTTAPLDIKAIKEWVEATRAVGADKVIPSLPSLATGEGWFWIPEDGVLERVKVLKARSLDTSATPEVGAKAAAAKKLKPIDLAALGERMQSTVAKAKENDPAELRKRLAAVERERDHLSVEKQLLETRVAELEAKPQATVEVVEVPMLDPELVERFDKTLLDAKTLGEQIKAAGGGLREIADETRVALHGAAATTAERKADVATAHSTPAPTAPIRAPRPAPAPQREPSAPARALAAAPDGLNISGPQRKILDALAALEAIGTVDAHKTQLALFAGASPKSSSYTNNLGHLNNQLGLIRYPAPGRVALTAEGRTVADASGAPSSTRELHDFVYSLVGGAKARLLQALVDVYPAALNKQQLADAVAASATSSSFTNNLGSLRSLGLIDYPQPGLIVALPVLFLEEAA